jgi:hypothetical protein
MKVFKSYFLKSIPRACYKKEALEKNFTESGQNQNKKSLQNLVKKITMKK